MGQVHLETRSVVVIREGERIYLPTARRVPCDCWIGKDHLQATEAEHKAALEQHD